MGIADAAAIAAGYEHSCALRRGGTISCWGNNNFGQLGNGQSGSSSVVPVQVMGITDATTISASWLHTCALHRTGTISCWGLNEDGELGNGTRSDSSVPVQVTGIADATAISLGSSYSCALHQNGTISCWGYNDDGQLGNGTTRNSLVPVQVVGITDATAISVGGVHTCALHRTGTISCWGRNERGGLGNGQSGNGVSSSLPVQVFGITDATAITAGWRHSCALRRGGTISCWGSIYFGQLGDGQSGRDTSSLIPVQVTDITDATTISASWLHTCALHQDGAISCWGRNERGELGNGTNRNSSVPVQVTGFGG